MTDKERKISHEEFFRKAILRLRDITKSRGVHTVFSGFNQAFRKYYNEDPIAVTQELARRGSIEIRPAKKGVMLYLPGEAPVRKDENLVLSKILDEPTPLDRSLVDQVAHELVPGATKVFPKDFIDPNTKSNKMTLPGTILILDPNSSKTVKSPKGHFRYEARNPSEAKFIVYAAKGGKQVVDVPADNRELFRVVVEFEKYCGNMRGKAFARFLELTGDEENAEALTRQLLKRFGVAELGQS